MSPLPIAPTGTSTVVAPCAASVWESAGVARRRGSSGTRVTSTWIGHGRLLRTRTGKFADLLMRLTAEDGSTLTAESMPVICDVIAVAESSCSEGVRCAAREGRICGVTESYTASGSSVAFARGARLVRDEDMAEIAVDVSGSSVPASTVCRSTSVGSLEAMSLNDWAETQRGEKRALTRLVRDSLMVVPRAAAAKRVRDEAGRSRTMIAVIAARACSASSSSPPEAFHDRIEARSACWASVRAPVPSVAVSPVAGLTFTRA